MLEKENSQFSSGGKGFFGDLTGFLSSVSVFLLLIFFTALWAQGDTVRVVTYNILNFPGNDYTTRLPYLRTVVKNIQPDVLVVQEMQSQNGVNYFLSDVLNSQYQAVPFHDGPDTDNALFYRSGCFTFLSANYLGTDLRDIAEYILRHQPSGEVIRIYSLHLKASQGATNEQKRLAEVSILKSRLSSLPPETNVLVLGDFNIYSSSEPAFQHLTGDGTVTDPIQAVGGWHNNITFAGIHTQSPRTVAFGGGSTGGLDDRFDMILFSDDLSDNYLSQSYTAFGNDGNHFNQSVNNGVNYAVPDSVADALYYSSDHIPVLCDFVFASMSGISRSDQELPGTPRLEQNYPNPFNPSTTISYFIPRTVPVRLTVYNILGREIVTLYDSVQSAGRHQIRWNPPVALSSGIYLYQLQSEHFILKRKMLLIR